MLNRIATVIVVGALAVGCGASRPQRPTQTYRAAFDMFAEGNSMDSIADTLALSDAGEARALIRAELIKLNHRINNEY